MEAVAILVTGAPGAGKSTVAGPLAAGLTLPLLSKDGIKETLYESLPPPSRDPIEWSRAIGSAAMELLWALAEVSPRVVLEANFRPNSDYERGRLLNLRRSIIEVHCACALDLAAERFAARAARPDHHRGAHPLSRLTTAELKEWDRPLGLGVLIEVDTTQPVDMPNLITEVTAAL